MVEESRTDFRISRRTFLKALGVTAGAGALGAAGLPVRFVSAAERPVQGTISVNTLCGICGPNCGIRAEVHDERVVALHGNPVDQVSRGKLCVKAYAAIKELYDPDRLKYPMKRTNPNKGPGHDPGWVKITWEEAIALTAQGLQKSIDEHGPQSVMFLSRKNPFLNRLARVIGTPNQLRHESTCYITYTSVYKAMVGWGNRTWHFDVDNAKYILAMGWDGPGKAKNTHSQGLVNALRDGAKLVVLDPRRTTTADMAAEWHPIKPGSDLAFALAMIHVIVTEELYDQEFVANYTTGIEQVAAMASGYTPEWAAELTDIPADAIRRIAREFAAAKPAMLVTHKRCAGGPNYANSTRLAQAQLILQCLVGVFDNYGGPVGPRGFPSVSFDATFPSPEFPPMYPERIDGWDKFPYVRHFSAADGHFPTMADGILNDRPYKVRAAIANKYNLFTFPHTLRAMEALKKLDFLAVIDLLPSELVQLADVVLPDSHWLEASAFNVRGFRSFTPQVGIRLPASKPLYDTRGAGGIWLAVAREMGFGEYFEGVSGGAWNNAQLKAWGTSWDELKDSPDGMFTIERPFTPATSFRTKSGKIELYATAFEEEGVDPLPTWKPKKEHPSNEYPFYFLISRPPMHKMSQSQNNELLDEIWPENTVELHPTAAQNLGLRDGDLARVTSRVGSIVLKTQVTNAIRPDCVCVMHGFGHWSEQLSVAYRKGANEGDLIPDQTVEEVIAAKDPGASANMCDFCVRVEKA